MLSNSLLIKLHSSPIAEFDPKPAIEYWLAQKERRPGSSGTAGNKQSGLYIVLHQLYKTIDFYDVLFPKCYKYLIIQL